MKRTHDDMEADNPPAQAGDEIDSTDGLDAIPPYDAKSEPMPESPVFSEEYQKILARIHTLVKLLSGPLEQSDYHDAVVDGLLREVRDRTTSEFPEEVRIALIGDMKSGKSSVINSILSTGMIARQGDAGSSCTWVVQEFGYLFPDQKQSFAAQVYFFSQEDRHAIIRSLVADFYRANANDGDGAGGPKDSDQTVEDFAVKRTVITAFRALFNRYDEFASFTTADDFLSNASSEDDDYIIDKLCDWSDEIMASGLGKESFLTQDAATVQKLLWQLAPYMYTVEEREGELLTSLWPFVSHIKFGLNIPLLKHNITLVDLPGLSDANKTRVANATNHLRQCTHYMIVAEIGRADDDKFIRDGLTKGFMTRGQGRTMLVLTHADTIDEATEVRGSQKDFRMLESLTSDLQGLERKKMETVARIRSSKGLEKYQWMEAKDRVVYEIREKKAQHQEVRIQMRSRLVMRQMQELYAELTPDPTKLPVFCVGNAAYKKHQAGYTADDPSPPTLSVEGTNIPAVRRHLFLAPAEAKLNDARHLVATQLPSLLACFKLYVSKTHMARKDEVEKIIMEPQSTASSTIEGIWTDLYSQVDEVLGQIMDLEYEWTEEAQTLCRQWAKAWTPAQHLAILKKQGMRKGKGKNAASISWTGELVGLRSGELRHLFQEFTHAANNIPREVTKSLHKLLSGVMFKIKSDPQVTLMALQPYLDYLFLEKGNIQKFVDTAARQMRKDFGNILMALTSEAADNPIVLAMVPVYDHAITIKGKVGKPADRLRIFEMLICTTGPIGVWCKAHDHLKKQLHELLVEHSSAFENAARQFFSKIQQQFHNMCSTKEIEDPEEIELRQQLQKALALATEMLDDEIRPAADRCFGTY